MYRANNRNFILMTDSYKLTHYKQYPPQTSKIYSYLESRGGQFDETVFFGLQYYLKKYLAGPVFNINDVEEAVEFCQLHFVNPNVFNRSLWSSLYYKYGGNLPIRITAVPEGTAVNLHNVLMTIENTDPAYYWLTNVLETLLMKLWYPISVATLSRALKAHIVQNLIETGDPTQAPFKLHDFGYRGVSSEESASIGGAAHLLNFQGTDTLAGIQLLQKYYGPASMPGFSVPATEHSTMTTWGPDKEIDAVANDLKAYPTGILSIVGDSYNIYDFCQHVLGDSLREQVLQREGKVVVRPDSGDPKSVVLRCLEILGEKFGFETNEKGYRVLNPHIGVIQGDGMNYHTCRDLFNHLKSNGWSGDNLAIGMGGKLLQDVNRDTQKFAIKCSYAEIDGVGQEVFKKPVTDSGKDSKRGRLALLKRDDGSYVTMKQATSDNYPGNELVQVFLNGRVTKEYSLEDIRQRTLIQTPDTVGV